MKKKLVKVRTALLVLLTHKVALPLIKQIRKPSIFTWEMNQLQAFPEGSLGNDLFKFLAQRNLVLLKHYARHDLKHVLLKYDTTEEGEVCLQSFMLGNGRVSFPVLATVLFGMFTMPEHWKKMSKAFQTGRKSISIHNWKWNEILNEPTILLQEKIFTR